MMVDPNLSQETKRWISRLYEELTGTGPGGGGISGTLVELAETGFSGAANFELTWDESLYDEIIVYIDGLQPATDGASLYLILGDSNGANMHNTAGDYDGGERVWEGTLGFSAMPVSDVIRLAGNCGSTELLDGKINVMNMGAGGAVHGIVKYENADDNFRVFETKAFPNDAVGRVVIDTLRIYFATGNINAGTIRVKGLVK